MSFIKKDKIEYALIFLEIFLIVVLILLVAKDLNDIWSVAWKAIVIIFSIYFIFLFARIHWAERKIISLYKKRDEEIKNIEARPVSMRVIDGMTRKKELDFQGPISFLERQRKFDLEKIPFLKN